MLYYTKEQPTELIPKVQNLFETHFNECKDFDSDKCSIDWSTYSKYEDSIASFGAYNYKRELVGYACFFLFDNHQHGNRLDANQDAIYIMPEYRKNNDFIAWCDNELKTIGVKCVFHHVKPYLDWSSSLISNGYKHIETIYAKQLGV